MNKTNLIAQLAQHGFPLQVPQIPVEETLIGMIESRDTRILEGFPVVFLHAVRKGNLSWLQPGHRVSSRKSLPHDKNVGIILATCLALFEDQKVEEGPQRAVMRLIKAEPAWSRLLSQVRKKFQEGNQIRMGNTALSPDRIRQTYEKYQTGFGPENYPLLKLSMEIRKDLLLSEIFSPRQKEIIRKQLDKEPFTKTEREYYSRVIKKRLLALADEDLHRLARTLLMEGNP